MRKIKIFIEQKRMSGGPCVFKNRLSNVLSKYDDIEIINNINDKFDIELAFIRKVYCHDKPYVLRVDGCYYIKGRVGNKKIIEAMKDAKFLIYQSNFSFNLCDKVLGKESRKGKNYFIIYNGIDLDYIDNIKKDMSIEPESFVACARWRDNKRPISMIKGFLEANTGKHLYIIGDNVNKKYNSKFIHILGLKKQQEIISIMKGCKYLIHLCHIDSCPNVVIEGLCCGLNVLCTNLGGTKEIVKENGVVLQTDKMWDGKMLEKNVVLDKLDKKIVANGIRSIMSIESKKIDRSFFDIKKVADQYVKIIKDVI